jgi:hypothetical protein
MEKNLDPHQFGQSDQSVRNRQFRKRQIIGAAMMGGSVLYGSQRRGMAELISSPLCELGPGQQWLGPFSFDPALISRKYPLSLAG